MSDYSMEEPIDPQPSTEGMFGRYRLAYALASGGMGTVFLARSEGPGGFEKLVALKRIHPHMATDKRFVSMFLDEARIAARIQHPNVCSVLDFGEVDGSFYLTMPYILGESLNRVIGTAAKLTGGPLLDALPLMAARMVADACEGLHAAHELRDDRGQSLEVVHRDVSPHNLMAGYDGVVRVLDFGVASAKHRLHQTATGEVKGKFAYLAPEQLESLPADRRADIWALGVVLWEAVTARRLFARENMLATVRAVSEMPIPRLSTLRPNAPSGLDDVIAKALARDPSQRYSSARAMGRDLQQILAKADRFVGAPELADWMEELMPRERQVQERLVDATRTLSASEISGISERARVPRRIPATLEMAGPPEMSPAPSTTFVPARSRAPVLWIGAIGALALAATGFGATVWWLTRAEPEMRVAEMPAAHPAIDPPASPPSPPIAASATVPSEPSRPPSAPSPVVAETEATPTPPGDPAPEPAPRPSPPAPALATTIRTETARETAPAPSTARPRGNGTLTVATPGGWGMVFLGRRALGEAPGVFVVPAGPQTIQIQPFGRGNRIARRVVVPENGTARVSIPLGS